MKFIANILFIAIAVILFSCKNNISDIYNLEFIVVDSICYKWNVYAVNDKKNCKILIRFFNQTIPLPDSNYDDEITISLNTKCNKTEFILKCIGLDYQENIVFIDSIKCNNNKWQKVALLITYSL